MQRRHLVLGAGLAALVIVVALAVDLRPFVSTPPQPLATTLWPTRGWTIAQPEQQGVDSARLAAALDAIRAKQINIHSLLLVRNGQLILDATFYPYDGSTPHELASVTKSLTTTLVGIAIDQGKLRLDQPVLSFFPERTVANRDPRKERMTVGNLASMSSGLACFGPPGAPDEPTLHEMQQSPDWVQFTLDLPMLTEPGSSYAYCSPGMHLLSAILTKATGVSELDYARGVLFEPLGITDVIWPADSQGFSHGWGDVVLYPRDAAKLGYLWLNKGKWEDRQLVSRGWVEDSVTIHLRTGGRDDYGYGWWIMTGSEFGEYAAIGRGGQRVGVLPVLSVVFVTTGGGFETSEATDLLAPALLDPRNPLPPNPAGVAALQAALTRLQQTPEATPVPTLPEIAARVSGKTYAFGPNALGLMTIRLAFDGSETATMSFTTQNGRVVDNAPVGLDGVYRFSPGANGFRVGARGAWIDDDTFSLTYDEIANRDAYRIDLRFQDEVVRVSAQERTAEVGMQFTGRVLNP